MAYRVAVKARNDLDSIWLYLAKQYPNGEAIADRQIDARIDARPNDRAMQSFQGRALFGRQRDIRRGRYRAGRLVMHERVQPVDLDVDGVMPVTSAA